MWLYALDTKASRKRVARKIQAIANRARNDAETTEHAKALLRKTNSQNAFEAAYAASALGTIGDAAVPIINEIADLMNSDNPFVRREASRSLSRLGTRSAPVLDALKVQVANGDSNGDVAWFAAAAIGEIGESACECIPLLESKLGSGAPQFDDSLKRSIEKLRKACDKDNANQLHNQPVH